MMVAVAGAVVLGEWAEGASVVFLFALAQMLEARAMERARGAIRALMDLAPAEALVRARRRRIRWSPVDEVRVGDLVVVRPGEKVPARRPVRGGREPRQPGADHRRIAAGREGAGRRGVRRDHQRPRRARGRGHAPARATRRWPASSTWSSGRRRSARRARPSSIGSRASTRRSSSCWRCDCRRAAARARRGHGRCGRLDLPRARAARHLVPVRAGDLDAGVDRVGAGRGGAQGRADQGRRAPRNSSPRSAAWRSTRPAR